MTTTIRKECGSKEGWIAHQSHGEPICGWCLRAERITRLTAEAIPTPAHRETALRRAELAREAALFDAEHAGESRRRWLRPVPPSEPEGAERAS